MSEIILLVTRSRPPADPRRYVRRSAGGRDLAIIATLMYVCMCERFVNIIYGYRVPSDHEMRLILIRHRIHGSCKSTASECANCVCLFCGYFSHHGDLTLRLGKPTFESSAVTP